MRKLLLSTAAVCGLAVAASPAHADIDLELGGWFKGYGVYVDQDDNTVATDDRSFDILRHTEIHMGGETTLDNGLTVGFHLEAEADGDSPTSNDTFDVEESYAYFSGGWGRVNFGAEDGAAYLLQVEAPSADGNIDGIRSYIQPVNYTITTGTGLTTVTSELDYDQDVTGYADKFTYLSPIMNGFQVGLSYVPDVADTATDFTGVGTDGANNTLGAAYEAGVRYEGMFNNVGVIVGAGYSHVDLEEDTDAISLEDDRTLWNVGVDLDIGPFGVGVAYMEDDFAETAANTTDDDEQTLVVGVDYTTGPFKLGASYMNKDATGRLVGNTGTDGVETDRYTGGVVYTYGPGMTFRGSISHIEHDNVAAVTGGGDSVDATSVMIGTQINF